MGSPGDIYIDVRDRDFRAVVRDVARAIGFAWRLDEQNGLVVISPLVSRDELAARAMQGLLAASFYDRIGGEWVTRDAQLASRAYQYADAMLREREKQSNRKEP